MSTAITSGSLLTPLLDAGGGSSSGSFLTLPRNPVESRYTAESIYITCSRSQ